MYSKSAESHIKCIAVTLYRSVHSVSLAVCVLMAFCQMVKEVVLRKSTVPAHMVEYPINLDRRSLWTVIPGECSCTTAMLCSVSSHFLVSFLNWNI